MSVAVDEGILGPVGVPPGYLPTRLTLSEPIHVLSEPIRVLPNKFTAMYLKGRSNYVCLNRLKRAESMPVLSGLEEMEDPCTRNSTGRAGSSLAGAPRRLRKSASLISEPARCLLAQYSAAQMSSPAAAARCVPGNDASPAAATIPPAACAAPASTERRERACAAAGSPAAWRKTSWDDIELSSLGPGRPVAGLQARIAPFPPPNESTVIR